MAGPQMIVDEPPGQIVPTTFLQRAGQKWEAIKDIWHVLFPMRFSIIIILVTIPFLWMLQQSKDALLALIDDLQPGQITLFVLFWFSWAFSSFYWARFMSRLPPRPLAPRRYDPLIPPERLRKLERTLPWQLGAAVIIVVAVALLIASWPLGWWKRLLILFVTVILYGLYHSAVLWRRDWMTALHRLTGWRIFVVDRKFVRDLTKAHALPALVRGILIAIAVGSLSVFLLSVYFPIATWVAALLMAIWLFGGLLGLRYTQALPPSTAAFVGCYFVAGAALFATSLYPAWSAQWISSPVIIMSIAALWVFIGTFFLAYPGALIGLPMTAILIAGAVLLSTIGSRDNHEVRTLSEEIKLGDGSGGPRLPVRSAFDAWYASAGTIWHHSNHTGPVPLVIVATAGGASRAAYWTARVLTRFEQRIPGFHDYLFAISSVSGGSLGAGTYRAILNALPDDPETPNGGWEIDHVEDTTELDVRLDRCRNGINTGTLLDCAETVVRQDFLSPTFLTGLYADLTQRFLPGSLLPDRGNALEKAWESAWQHSLPPHHSLQFDAPFHSFWPEKRKTWLPALQINGTSTKSGRRIITSNISIATDKKCYSENKDVIPYCQPGSRDFPDAIDFFAWIKKEIRFSTALHNSARFPYIDAAGTLRPATEPIDRIIDGGYFENFGAATAFDLVETLAPIRPDVTIYVLQIVSDPDIKGPEARDAELNETLTWGYRVASDASTPLLGFWDTRDGLGSRATEVLARLLQTKHYFAFRVRNHSEPMSWALSKAAVRMLDCEWSDDPTCTPTASDLGGTNSKTYDEFVCSAGFRKGGC